MAQRKRNSPALTKAERRIEGIQMINPELDFGSGLSIASYNTKILDIREKLAAYNQARSLVDKTQNALLEAERELNTYSEQMLLSVASRYGKNSDEYGLAGGTRRVRSPEKTPSGKSNTNVCGVIYCPNIFSTSNISRENRHYSDFQLSKPRFLGTAVLCPYKIYGNTVAVKEHLGS